MKSQIALIGLGVLVASGVAYAELRPPETSPTITNVSTTNSPDPVVSPTSSQTPKPVSSLTPKKSDAPKIANPAISKPSISGGDEDDEDHGEREHGERGEEDDD